MTEQQRVADLEAEVGALKRQVRQLRVTQQEHGEYIDTVSSALWKRLLWWCQGYYFRKVGRWYGGTEKRDAENGSF